MNLRETKNENKWWRKQRGEGRQIWTWNLSDWNWDRPERNSEMNEWMRGEDALDTELRNDESIAQNGQHNLWKFR